MEDSYTVGQKLASKLNKEPPVHVMIFSEGININGNELTKGIINQFDDWNSLTGELAGDHLS